MINNKTSPELRHRRSERVLRSVVTASVPLAVFALVATGVEPSAAGSGVKPGAAAGMRLASDDGEVSAGTMAGNWQLSEQAIAGTQQPFWWGPRIYEFTTSQTATIGEAGTYLISLRGGKRPLEAADNKLVCGNQEKHAAHSFTMKFSAGEVLTLEEDLWANYAGCNPSDYSKLSDSSGQLVKITNDFELRPNSGAVMVDSSRITPRPPLGRLFDRPIDYPTEISRAGMLRISKLEPPRIDSVTPEQVSPDTREITVVGRNLLMPDSDIKVSYGSPISAGAGKIRRKLVIKSRSISEDGSTTLVLSAPERDEKNPYVEIETKYGSGRIQLGHSFASIDKFPTYDSAREYAMDDVVRVGANLYHAWQPIPAGITPASRPDLWRIEGSRTWDGERTENYNAYLPTTIPEGLEKVGRRITVSEPEAGGSIVASLSRVDDDIKLRVIPGDSFVGDVDCYARTGVSHIALGAHWARDSSWKHRFGQDQLPQNANCLLRATSALGWTVERAFTTRAKQASVETSVEARGCWISDARDGSARLQADGRTILVELAGGPADDFVDVRLKRVSPRAVLSEKRVLLDAQGRLSTSVDLGDAQVSNTEVEIARACGGRRYSITSP